MRHDRNLADPAGRVRGGFVSPTKSIHWLSLGLIFVSFAATSLATAQSFTLDDYPWKPLIGPPGSGCGPSDPFHQSATCATALGPSATLGPVITPKGSGTILGPGPTTVMPNPAGYSISSLSGESDFQPDVIAIRFSVDRGSAGAPGTDVATQVGLNQHPGDLFESVGTFQHPSNFTGTLGAGPYAGVLASIVSGSALNTLFLDDSTLGLLSGGGVVDSITAAPAITAASHDNLEAFTHSDVDGDQDSYADLQVFFTVNPDGAMALSGSAADIFEIAAGTAVTWPLPFATAGTMGLDAAGTNTDAIDALIVYDVIPFGGPVQDGPEAEPGWDYALFSLAPGSASLATHSLTPADVLFTDFSGAFAVFAQASDIGLVGTAGGAVGAGDNIDAIDVPEPGITLQLGFGVAFLIGALRRRCAK